VAGHQRHRASGTDIVSVREALRQCRGLLLFVSVASLGSLWVGKEFGLPLDELTWWRDLACPIDHRARKH
jgi:hypothetical protein